MPNELSSLSIEEVSLCDRPANSSKDPKTGVKRAHAVVAIWKRDSKEDKLSPGQVQDGKAASDKSRVADDSSSQAFSAQTDGSKGPQEVIAAHKKAASEQRSAASAHMAAYKASGNSAQGHKEAAEVHGLQAAEHDKWVSALSDPAHKRDGDDVALDALENVEKDGKTRGGVTYPKGDWAFTPTDKPSDWKLRIYDHGKPDSGIVGAAVAALGKGFRGKKVQIPAEALSGVKAKVRAAWKAANPGRGGEELPPVLKGETTMTLEELATQVTKMDGVIATLTAERDFAKSESETVLKMSKKERKLYATMDPDKRKAYMAADVEKRKAMLEDCATQKKTKALEDGMDEATKKRYDACGPLAKRQILDEVEKAQIKKREQEEIAQFAKAQKAKNKGKDNEQPLKDQVDDAMDAADDEDDEEGDVGKVHKALAATQDDVAVLKAELTAVKKRERLEHFAKRAEEELPHTSGTPQEKGLRLQKLADVYGEDTEDFKTTFNVLKQADKALSAHFREKGGVGADNVPVSKQIDLTVSEIRKRDKIDEGHAMMKAMEEHPELFMEYNEQKRRNFPTGA